LDSHLFICVIEFFCLPLQAKDRLARFLLFNIQKY